MTASGQRPSSEALRSEPPIRLSPGCEFLADPLTLESCRPGVFAGGDLTLGPAQAIDAVAVGREAAESIARLMRWLDLRERGERVAKGFLLEAHMKLRPVDLASDRQFLADLPHFPKPQEESLSQAKSAARASVLLSRPFVLTGGAVAECDPAKCAACLTCSRSCPARVPRIIPNGLDPALPGHAYMEPAICQGCKVWVPNAPPRPSGSSYAPMGSSWPRSRPWPRAQKGWSRACRIEPVKRHVFSDGWTEPRPLRPTDE
ncbi:MAG: hypothetical protein LBR80_02075 [Deltaproteobacteria bacterium]|nr:hypothetical protein [Deltaproteobacteria bacterium]